MTSAKNILFPHHTGFIFAWSLFQDVPSIYLITEINQGIRSRKASGKNEKLFVVSDKGIHLKFYFTFTSSFPLASVQHSLSFFKLSSSVSFEARSGSSSWSNDINRRQVYPALLRRLQHTTNCSCGHRSNLLIHTG